MKLQPSIGRARLREAPVACVGRPRERSPGEEPWLLPGRAGRHAVRLPILLVDRAVGAALCLLRLSGVDCPAFRDAVLLAAVRDMTGQRRVVSVRETGAFPEPVVAKAQRELRAFGPGVEFHLHLLAASPAERAATVADLAIAQA